MNSTCKVNTNTENQNILEGVLRDTVKNQQNIYS